MRCPRCDAEAIHVLETRHAAGAIRRRRECRVCGWRWSTTEMPRLSGRSSVEQALLARQVQLLEELVTAAQEERTPT